MVPKVLCGTKLRIGLRYKAAILIFDILEVVLEMYNLIVRKVLGIGWKNIAEIV